MIDDDAWHGVEGDVSMKAAHGLRIHRCVSICPVNNDAAANFRTFASNDDQYELERGRDFISTPLSHQRHRSASYTG